MKILIAVAVALLCAGPASAQETTLANELKMVLMAAHSYSETVRLAHQMALMAALNINRSESRGGFQYADEKDIFIMALKDAKGSAMRAYRIVVADFPAIIKLAVERHESDYDPVAELAELEQIRINMTPRIQRLNEAVSEYGDQGQ